MCAHVTTTINSSISNQATISSYKKHPTTVNFCIAHICSISATPSTGKNFYVICSIIRTVYNNLTAVYCYITHATTYSNLSPKQGNAVGLPCRPYFHMARTYRSIMRFTTNIHKSTIYSGIGCRSTCHPSDIHSTTVYSCARCTAARIQP